MFYGEQLPPDIEYDIDSTIDTIYAYSAVSGRGPCLAWEQWQKLPPDARKT